MSGPPGSRTHPGHKVKEVFDFAAPTDVRKWIDCPDRQRTLPPVESRADADEPFRACARRAPPRTLGDGARAKDVRAAEPVSTQSFARESLSAFEMTETELRLIAAAAIMGESSMPVKG